MKLQWKRFLFGTIMFSTAILSVGWQTEAGDESLYILTQGVARKVEGICALEENNQLFFQEISCTEVSERWRIEQDVEREREEFLEREKKEEEERKRKKGELKQRTARFASRSYVQKKRKAEKRAASVPACAKTESSRDILYRIVEAEAGDQDVRGRRLVANVILNRIKSKEFPDTVRGVVFEHRQFSPVSNGRYYNVSVSENTKKAVGQALQGIDDSKGALYFMWRKGASARNASWFDRALTKLFTHGCHEFFR